MTPRCFLNDKTKRVETSFRLIIVVVELIYPKSYTYRCASQFNWWLCFKIINFIQIEAKNLFFFHISLCFCVSLTLFLMIKPSHQSKTSKDEILVCRIFISRKFNSFFLLFSVELRISIFIDALQSLLSCCLQSFSCLLFLLAFSHSFTRWWLEFFIFFIFIFLCWDWRDFKRIKSFLWFINKKDT